MSNRHGPHLAVPVGPSDHVQGEPHAPITLVEYGDYECPHCGRAYPIVKTLQRRLGPQLRFVFRNMPLTQSHPHAELAAEAAEAAALQAKFWEMHDALFEHQRELSPTLVLSLAKRLHLDVERFENDLRHASTRARVRNDVDSASRSGVEGTPTFFINGEMFQGDWTDADAFADALAPQER